MARKPKGRKIDGWLVIDKPAGMTSTDVVNRLKRAFDAQKVGHGGTLDPLATGVLPIAFGAATKTVPYVMDGTKAYRFTLQGGEALTADEFRAAGGNLSAAHVDFMIGSAAMDIYGVCEDGVEEPLMRQGEWTFKPS